ALVSITFLVCRKWVLFRQCCDPKTTMIVLLPLVNRSSSSKRGLSLTKANSQFPDSQGRCSSNHRNSCLVIGTNLKPLRRHSSVGGFAQVTKWCKIATVS